MTLLGLRIDVDTFRGTRCGVPNLCKVLDAYNIKASFFFSVGPDNMGRHLWRLIRPSFLRKILRSNAPGLYGWDILLRGTFGPGPIIGERLADIIRKTSDAGHEIGFHAWDHHAWQMHIDTMTQDNIYHSIRRGVDLLSQILGYPPICSAAPSWKCNHATLLEKSKFPFAYNSDCRGQSIFYPLINGKKLSQPQIPVTLPTYDEIIGHKGITNMNYNNYMLSLIKPEKLNVLTIHAEVEGIACLPMFEHFIKTAKSNGISFIPLKTFLSVPLQLDISAIVPKEILGRDGWVSCQER